MKHLYIVLFLALAAGTVPSLAQTQKGRTKQSDQKKSDPKEDNKAADQLQCLTCGDDDKDFDINIDMDPVAVSIPAIEIEAIEIPAIEIPAVEIDDVVVPAISIPAISVPAISIPAVTVPPVEVPAINIDLSHLSEMINEAIERGLNERSDWQDRRKSDNRSNGLKKVQ